MMIHPDTHLRLFYLFGAILATALLVTMVKVHAHEWYDSFCCGGQDCKPVACDELVEDKTGWLYLPTQNHFEPNQVHPSQDRYCHICVTKPGQGTPVGRSLCAYIQQGV